MTISVVITVYRASPLKADGRWQMAEGINPDTFCTLQGRTGSMAEGGKGIEDKKEEETQAFVKPNLLPSALCLLPSSINVSQIDLIMSD